MRLRGGGCVWDNTSHAPLAQQRVRWRSRLSSLTVNTGSTPGAAILDDQWAYWKHWDELWHATDSWLFLAARCCRQQHRALAKMATARRRSAAPAAIM